MWSNIAAPRKWWTLIHQGHGVHWYTKDTVYTDTPRTWCTLIHQEKSCKQQVVSSSSLQEHTLIVAEISCRPSPTAFLTMGVIRPPSVATAVAMSMLLRTRDPSPVHVAFTSGTIWQTDRVYFQELHTCIHNTYKQDRYFIIQFQFNSRAS